MSTEPVPAVVAADTQVHAPTASGKTSDQTQGKPRFNIVATYDYTDEEGVLLYQVVRFEPKGFRQRRPDPEGKAGWTWKLQGVRRVLYRLPEIIKAKEEGRTIFVVVGEKDADNLVGLGMVATTNSGGAGKWQKEFTKTLQGAHIVLLPKNNSVAQGYARELAKRLKTQAASIKMLDLPGLPENGDVSDWLNAGGAAEQLDALVANLDEFTWDNADGQRSEAKDPEEEKRATEAQTLIQHAESAVLFHDADRRAFATVPVDNHHETLAVRSGDFKRWLVRAFFCRRKKPPSATALSDALSLIEARAIFDGPELPIHIRVGEHEGKLYLDLCNAAWEVIEITPDGWRVLSSCDVPVKFRRARGLKALPRPLPGGNLESLRRLVNVGEQRQWHLLVGWLLMAFRGRGPYPVLCLHGEQGSAKSTFVRILRCILDPHTVPLRSEPKEPRDLMIWANNSWCITLDNLSHISDWLSDALCRLATGGGFGTRELYTNDEEQLFDAMRPVVINGIEAVATRPDLLERSIVLYLPTIPDHDRRTEDELWFEVEAALPAILGAILDTLSATLRQLPKVKLQALPRMADFVRWVTAAEPALGWKPGTFLASYSAIQADANSVALEAYPVVEPLRQLVQTQDPWEGTATELLTALRLIAGEVLVKEKDWPKKPNILSGQLRRLSPNLRKIGVQVVFGSAGGGQNKSRRITLSKAGQSSSPSSPPSPGPLFGTFGDDSAPVGDDQCPPGNDGIFVTNPMSNSRRDGGDDGDGLAPVSSECRPDR